MNNLEVGNRIVVLMKTINELEEKKKRVVNLNSYDHEKDDLVRPFFIELGGSCVHTKFCIRTNDIGNRMETFFVSLFDEITADAYKELSGLLCQKK